MFKYAKSKTSGFFRYSKLSLPQQPPLTQLLITFELDLQDLVQILQDVSVGLKGMARTVYANFQAKVGLCKEDNSVRNSLRHLGQLLAQGSFTEDMDLITPRLWVGLRVRDAIRAGEQKLPWKRKWEAEHCSFTCTKSPALAKRSFLSK